MRTDWNPDLTCALYACTERTQILRSAAFLSSQQEEVIQPDEIPGYHFTSPDPYARCAPLPDGHAQHRMRFDEEGHIIVKNPSACWFPDVTIQREIDGTIYSVTGSYDGSETLDEKLTRMMEQDAKNLEESE